MPASTSARFAFVLLAVASCSSEDRRSAPAARDVAERPALSNATAFDLAREIDDADRRGTWLEVKKRWQGQRLRWRVTRHRLLCSSETACHVAALPIQRPATHGWMPQLALSAREMERVETACGTAEPCELTFEGTLSELVLSPELPTNVRFSDVRVIRAHES